MDSEDHLIAIIKEAWTPITDGYTISPEMDQALKDGYKHLTGLEFNGQSVEDLPRKKNNHG